MLIGLRGGHRAQALRILDLGIKSRRKNAVFIIIRMQPRGQLLKIIGDPMRLERLGARLKYGRIFRQRFDQVQLIGRRQDRPVYLCGGRDLDASLRRYAEDAGNPRVGVLHVVDGVVG